MIDDYSLDFIKAMDALKSYYDCMLKKKYAEARQHADRIMYCGQELWEAADNAERDLTK